MKGVIQMDENNIIIKFIDLVIMAIAILWAAYVLIPSKPIHLPPWAFLTIMATYGWHCLFDFWLYDKNGEILTYTKSDGSVNITEQDKKDMGKRLGIDLSTLKTIEIKEGGFSCAIL